MHTKMTRLERRAVISLSTIMSLRMIGLFMVIPIFSLYAQQLRGATPTLIGLAIGIYGLSQAVLQIPCGALSDRFGRKSVVCVGLLLFALGSLTASCADSISVMIVGRTLQGMGAVGSTLLAMMADFTREEQRTKSMAIAGICIGFSFSIAMIIGPFLLQWLPINTLFLVAMTFGLLNIVLLYWAVPSTKEIAWQPTTESLLKALPTLLRMPALARLNAGIFLLHAIFTAIFVVLPISLDHQFGFSAHHQWMIYLPALLIAMVASLGCIGIAERKKQTRSFFVGGVFTLCVAECFLWLAHTNLSVCIIGTCLFFTAFSLLEAFLPSLVSRTAPKNLKGSALGIYSCSQFSGIFVGGVLGGWLYGRFSYTGVYLLCIIFTLAWLKIALRMQFPQHSRLQPQPDSIHRQEPLQSESS
ncbi:MAG TPA: MFS transporter [Gammaproteobacteria bacterium]|jgi:MFS family permease|nr:MFS transporter [Gammaproteobacteria bacterium]